MSVKGGMLNNLNVSNDTTPNIDLDALNNEVVALEGIPSLLSLLRLGTPNQKHDAAKALGYIGKLGQMSAGFKIEAKNVITDILTNEYPSLTNAFAMLEALERIDNDAFWTLIMSYYGQSNKIGSNASSKKK